MKPLRHPALSVLMGALLAVALVVAPRSASAQAPAAGAQQRVELGVYYYPGWHSIAKALGATREPWSYLKAYPERMPLNGWYRGADSSVVRQQAAWMLDAGVDYVAFDWYYDYGKVHLGEPLQAYQAIQGKKPAFSIMWANHGQQTSAKDWVDIVDLWIKYAKDPSYYKIGGKPVVFVFSVSRFLVAAQAAGVDGQTWINQAQAQARAAGLPGIYFVGSVNNADPATLGLLAKSGFDSVSAYNLNVPHRNGGAQGYAARDDAYRAQWSTLLNLSGLPLVVPMTSGWDRRPWGGSKDPRDDNSISSPDQFRAHLSAGKAFMAAHGLKTAVLCCWNEYGEGSFIEPTRRDGSNRLKTIKSVFGRR